jgi:sec-independent protein translocase protein TatA
LVRPAAKQRSVIVPVGIFSPWHLAILLVDVLLVFGPRKLPEMGRSLGRGMREFKDSVTGNETPEEPRALAVSTSAEQVAASERQAV